MTLQQVADLRAEGDELHAFLDTIPEDQWARETPFKARTINWVVKHLHDADRWAVHSVIDPEGFRAWRDQVTSVPLDDPAPAQGRALLELWRSYFVQLCDALEAADPDLRAPWFGPDMGIRMMATARQMETWAHGQDIYALLQVGREASARIRNICHIGVRTFGWTFVNRKLPVPEPAPYIRLDAPSGAVWEWNAPSEQECVAGSAVEFAHVVTQGRNIADCNLAVTGPVANAWMAIAKCFAGPPEDPPPPGHRAW
ncbi:MAG: TIGR03084 family metal-binding protein [Gammaproteobacteria bacterium]|nr:TIGR03084 family metal-binding protein [Gammaproteobacteria bacterium]